MKINAIDLYSPNGKSLDFIILVDVLVEAVMQVFSMAAFLCITIGIAPYTCRYRVRYIDYVYRSVDSFIEY